MYPTNVGPGLFLPTTLLIDTQAIYDNPEITVDVKNILIRMNENLNDIFSVTNLKDTGIYNTVEFVTGQVYFPNPTLSSTTSQLPVQRQVFRCVVDFGALPNTALKSVPHGITVTDTFTWVAIYATATDPIALTAFPIPNQSVTGNIAYLYVDATDVNIETNFDATANTICYVVLEYIKQ